MYNIIKGMCLGKSRNIPFIFEPTSCYSFPLFPPLRILSLMVLGNSSTNSIILGYL